MMSSFIKEYRLVQHTPLIHFQSDESGATLRATEVKPKLDRFIAKRKGNSIPEGWKLKNSDEKEEDKSCALNYKMRIVAGDIETVDVGFRTDYDIFYGNMNSSNPKKGVISPDITLTVICRIPELLETIDECISDFFIAENFGTMQNKGFGSYTVDNGNQPAFKTIAEVLKNQYGSRACYMCPGGRTPFKRIKTLYGIMKSGINNRGYQKSLLFIFLARKYGIKNEKAFLKRDKMAPRLEKSGLDTSPVIPAPDANDYNYVRALLGVGDHIDFKNSNGQSDEEKHDKTEIKFSNKEIERLNSPVFFKVINGNIYIVAKRINSEIYDKVFEFTAGPKKDKKAPDRRAFYPNNSSASLKVPGMDVLGEEFIDDFLDFCVDCFNGKKDALDEIEKDIHNFDDIRGTVIREVK